MLPWLAPRPIHFPPVDEALTDPDGLLAVGGELNADWLLAAYQRGIFPWFSDDQPILWWSPDPRMVLFPDQLIVRRSLAKRMRNAGFTVSANTAFNAVVDGCAAPRDDQPGTWITDDMRHAYAELHRLGAAQSVEVWREKRLVGGLYGVTLGPVFFGESMFSREADASKVALVTLARAMQAGGGRLIDCQMHTRHLQSLGARDIARHEFIGYLEKWLGRPKHHASADLGFVPTSWSFETSDTSSGLSTHPTREGSTR
ncbi:leucyl/phenylalanyl-tRNA--protein transferase [Halomonas urumqiensis]|uniref:Leucyl/phenylalanyl-tRNA--protein transferase n=1 Tax=Halomonas urumqiensis TaxID=1684789 RepID=A0A2N7UDY3_9GAMM|nr:leucyl/phenylalanyl-tRNA--protein transferase [Halomonas urumqiensis]PMR78676.1 leucyl/phenylalanyl-tRNA--protein transferase [Halomonas urumqiensis]PTB04326.1 leucyl/phenylalanyl-tRNA--protein transferase [Halomonas urumqiensis]